MAGSRGAAASEACRCRCSDCRPWPAHLVSPAAWRRIAASISLTVVLPLLPVIATRRDANRARQYAASLPRASAESSTSISSRASGGPDPVSHRLHHRRGRAGLQAPGRHTPGRRSARRGCRRTGRPACTSRLSVVTRMNLRIGSDMPGADCERCSGEVKHDAALPAAAAAVSRATSRIIERQPPAADFLIGLVAFAGNQRPRRPARPIAAPCTIARCTIGFDLE